jgi:hypothetical protein
MTPSVERYSVHDLQYVRLGLVIPDNEELCEPLIQALAMVDRSAADAVLGGCLFVMPAERAFYLSGEIINGRSLVLLPKTFLQLARGEQLRVILHEMAHHVLGHRSPRLESFTREQYDHQEREARRLVQKWQRVSAVEGQSRTGSTGKSNHEEPWP